MSISFRDAYTAHGVDNYYTLVSETYKNPHEPGVQKALRQILESVVPPTPTATPPPYYRLLDLAAGSGEATLTAKHWFAQRRPQYKLLLSAHDPFTAALYTRRTGGLPCGAQSFRDIQTRGLAVSPGRTSAKNDVVVVSFALHLCPPSEVWGLLWTLSCECRWLVVLAPHKRPEVGGEHGWERVGREVCVERVRGRLFRSLNFEDVEEVLVVGDTGAEEENGAEVPAPKEEEEEEEEEAIGKEKEKAVEPPAPSSSPQKETNN